jgi:ethanolamine transporter
MNINKIIIYLLAGFMTLGAVDKVLGNKLGLGKKFEEGFMAMGSLALAMLGMISLAPVLARFIEPVVVPLYRFFGADPSMFAGTFFANDMGGYPLALRLAENPSAGLFSGLLIGAMMGATIVFTIPVALGIIEKKDHRFLALGVLSGMITIPVGAFFGGIFAGFDVGMVLLNLIPISLVALCIIAGLWKFPEAMINGFKYLGKFITALITLAAAAIIIETLTGIVLVPGMAPLADSLKIIGAITIILAGAYPMVCAITKFLKKPLLSVGKMMSVNDKSVAGFIASLANNIPMFGMLKEMDNRGKVLNIAFAVSAAFVFGDHLGFTAGVNPDMIFPVIAGKLIGGMTAIIVAWHVYGREAGSQEKTPFSL